jgi:hypothetical protein
MLVTMAALLLAGSELFARLPGRQRLHGERSGGSLVLRPPRYLNVILGSMALPPSGVIAAVLIWFERRVKVSWPGLLVGAALVAAGLAVAGWLFVAEFRQRFLLDDFGIVRVGVATRRRLAWRAVDRIAYNPTSRWFFLTAGGSRLWISEDLNGVGDFAKLALTRLSPDVLRKSAEAREVLEELAELAAA